MDATYGAGVSRLVGYIEGLPPRGQSQWIDAAYEVYLSRRMRECGEESGEHVGSARASDEDLALTAGATR